MSLSSNWSLDAVTHAEEDVDRELGKGFLNSPIRTIKLPTKTSRLIRRAFGLTP